MSFKKPESAEERLAAYIFTEQSLTMLAFMACIDAEGLKRAWVGAP